MVFQNNVRLSYIAWWLLFTNIAAVFQLSSRLRVTTSTTTAFSPLHQRSYILRQHHQQKRVRIQEQHHRRFINDDDDSSIVVRSHHIPQQKSSLRISSMKTRQSHFNDETNANTGNTHVGTENKTELFITTAQKSPQRQRRRAVIDTMIGTLAISLLNQYNPQPCYASDIMTLSQQQQQTSPSNLVLKSQPPASSQLPMGLLESRVLENVLSYPPYGMEASDIIYPPWFYGTWNVASTTTSIMAPFGPSLFGTTNATYQAALAEIGTTLRYESRFIDIGSSGSNTNNNEATATSSNIIADRGYNVESIAKASLGQNSVVDIPYISANKLTAILSPMGSPNPLRVDLFAVNRRQEYINSTHFHCSEVVREIVSSIGNGNVNRRGSTASTTGSMSTILKEIETTTLYTISYDRNGEVTIRGRQRSAKFLVPTQNDAMSFRIYEMTRGKPVDVRFYDVIYTKKK